MLDVNTVRLKVWGPLACFTRPELKVERVSYPFMTPSAARGVLDAILFKKRTIGEGSAAREVPAFRWHVRRITAVEPPGGAPAPHSFISVRRNEIQGKIAPRTVMGWAREPDSFEPYLVDSAGREDVQGQNRTQRNTLALRDVAYIIDASVRLLDGRDAAELVKYREMFERRAENGQCFHRPYLGCREFACDFAPADPHDPHGGAERTVDRLDGPLGLMLYDIRFGDGAGNLPGFFHAEVRGGVLHCDTEGPGPGGEEPVSVLGWPEEEVVA